MNRKYPPKYRPATKQAIIIKDLRFGKYLQIPPHQFSGNILLTGNTYYEVQNNGSWKRIENPNSVENPLTF